ncbi:hypothetical protein BC826DRAFT_1192141 [Russula brevipes]|nr:hypothetical protein BC826DRAFT_1192141 [Russula brevipes]
MQKKHDAIDVRRVSRPIVDGNVRAQSEGRRNYEAENIRVEPLVGALGACASLVLEEAPRSIVKIAALQENSKISVPVLGVCDQIADTSQSLVENILPPELAEVRLPSPFHNTPPVSATRTHAERALQHQVNHVLIQLYRTDADYISEHSDKTVDVKDAAAVGVAATVTDGAAHDAECPAPAQLALRHGPRDQRVRDAQRHKRPEETKDPVARRAHQLDDQQQFIFGQGATGRTRAEARPVVHGGEEAERLLGVRSARRTEPPKRRRQLEFHRRPRNQHQRVLSFLFSILVDLLLY